MYINTLLGIGVFLVLFLAVLLLVFFLRTKEKKALSDTANKEAFRSLASLINNIKDKTTSTQGLQESLDYIVKTYGVIEDFSNYEEILIAITLHPNTNKNLILNFDKELSKRNPEYAKRISSTVTSALKLR